MLINKQAVKQYVHEQGKIMSKEAVGALDRKVMFLLEVAIKRSRQKTITEVEILV